MLVIEVQNYDDDESSPVKGTWQRYCLRTHAPRGSGSTVLALVDHSAVVWSSRAQSHARYTFVCFSSDRVCGSMGVARISMGGVVSIF